MLQCRKAQKDNRNALNINILGPTFLYLSPNFMQLPLTIKPKLAFTVTLFDGSALHVAMLTLVLQDDKQAKLTGMPGKL